MTDLAKFPTETTQPSTLYRNKSIRIDDLLPRVQTDLFADNPGSQFWVGQVGDLGGVQYDEDLFEIVARLRANVYSDDLLTSVSAMNRSVEILIRRDPTQYQWVYKRFKKCETLKNVYQ